jgi:hypothetical protein
VDGDETNDDRKGICASGACISPPAHMLKRSKPRRRGRKEKK